MYQTNSIFNNLRMLRFFPKLFLKTNSLPVYLVFFVTHRCIADCAYCFDWRRRSGIRQEDELSIDEIQKVSSTIGPMFLLFLTGGEPFLREDLSEIAKIFYLNNKILKYQIASNGMFTEKIISSLKQIAISCPGAHTSLIISIDGVKDEHDRIRGVKGLFANAMQTIKEIQELAEFYRNVDVNATITLSAYNKETAIDTYRYLTEKIGVRNVSVTLVRGKPKEPNSKAVEAELYERLQNEIAEIIYGNKNIGYRGFCFATIATYKDIYLRRIIANIIRNNRGYVPCAAGRL
ncbi:MAG: radical SAM protein [Candidatus Lokiarchaeia archaeon]